MLKDAIDVFMNYILNLPDPLWIRILALFGLIWIIFFTKEVITRLILIVVYVFVIILWISVTIGNFLKRIVDYGK